MMGARSGRARTSAIAASTTGGSAWLAWELSRRTWDDGAASTCASAADYFNDTLFGIATLSVAMALFSISTMLSGGARWMALLAAIGAFASGTGNAVEHCAAEPFFLVYVAGSALYAVMSCVLAVLLIRSELHRWTALFIGAAALGLMMFGSDRGGAAVTGVAWLACAASLVLPRVSAAAASRHE